MPKIPIISPGSARIRGVRQDVSSSGAFAQGVQAFSSDAQNVLNTWVQQDENAAMMRAQNQFLEQEAQVINEIESTSGIAAKGSTQKYQKNIDTIKSNISNNIGYGRVKEAFGVWAGEQKTRAWPKIAKFERGQDLAQAKADFNLRLTNLTLELQRDNDLEKAISSTRETFALGASSGIMLPEEAVAREKETIEQIRKESFKVEYQRNNDSAIKRISEWGLTEQDVAYWDSRYEADQKAKMRELEQMRREKAGVILSSVDGLEIIARETGDTSKMRVAAGKLFELGQDEYGFKILNSADTYDAAYGAIKEVKTVSISEAIKYVNGIEISKDDPTQAVQDFTVRDAAVKALNDRMKVYNNDPAASVDTMAAGDTPRERVQSRLNLQMEQGLFPKEGFRTLTNIERDQLSAQWNEAGADGKGMLVDKIRNDYGEYSSDVLNEIKVPAGAVFSAYLSNQYDKELMIRAATEKIETPPGLKDTDFKENTDTSDVVETLEAARMLMPSDEGYSRYVNEMRSTVTGLSKLLGNTDDGSKWMDDRFNSIEDSDMKIVFPSTLRSSDVEDALISMREDIARKAKTDDMKRALKQGIWVNDGDGFSLLSTRSGRVFAGTLVQYGEVEDKIAEESIGSTKKSVYRDKVSGNNTEYREPLDIGIGSGQGVL